MAITIPKNQALAFNPESACNCGGSYCQPWQTGDTINFQGKISPATGENILLNGDFGSSTGWTLGTGWKIAGGKLWGIAVSTSTTKATSYPLGMSSAGIYGVYADIQTYKGSGQATGLTVTSFTASTKEIVIAGDYTSHEGDTVLIVGGLNNKIVTFDSVVYATGNSTITVLESIVDESSVTCDFVYNPVNTINANHGYRMKLNGSYLPMPSTTAGSGTSQNLLLFWVKTAGSISRDMIDIECTDNNIVVQVNSLSAYKYSKVGLSAFNASGTMVFSDDAPAQVTYYPTSYYSSDNTTGTGSLSAPSVTWIASLNLSTWLGAISGCSRIGVYDSLWTGQNAVMNGNFDTDLSFWTAGTYWAWDAAQIAKWTPPGGTYTTSDLSQTVKLLGGLKYTFQFTETFTSPSYLCNVYYAVNGGTEQLLGSFAGVGSQSATLDLSAYSGIADVSIRFREGQKNHNIGIDAVSIIASAPDEDLITSCISIQASQSNTLLLSSSNNDSAFDLDFSHAFTMNLRMTARIDLTGYPEDVEKYTFSDNSEALLFARSQREYTVFTGDAPDHIHDCARIMRLMDQFSVTDCNGTKSFVREGGYSITRRKSSNLKQATFTIHEAVGVSSNYRLS